jgi:Tfp pilus assembly protein PilF
MNDPDLDEDALAEEAEQRAEYRKKMAIWVGTAAVLALIAIGIGAKSCTGTKKAAAKLQVKSAVARFEATPTDEALAKAAAAEYEAAGKKAEAEKILARHQAALAGGDKDREAALRAKLLQDPADDTALGQLVEIYVKRKDLPGGRSAYQEFVDKAPTPKRRATFGAWMYRNGFFEPAAKELAAAMKSGHVDPYTRGYLGLSLFELGRKKEAQKEIDLALEEGADLDLLRQKQFLLDEEIGAQPETPAAPVKPAKKAPRKK